MRCQTYLVHKDWKMCSNNNRLLTVSAVAGVQACGPRQAHRGVPICGQL